MLSKQVLKTDELAFSSISRQFPQITNADSRNVTSTYHLFSNDGKPFKDATEDGDTEWQYDPEKTIVIHPGSSTLKLALASDSVPKIVPHALAVRKSDSNRNTLEYMEEEEEELEKNEDYLEMEEIVKLRLGNIKKRVPLNVKQQVHGFNANSVGERIPDHNDAFRIEWTNVSHKPPILFGSEAQRIDFESEPYELIHPIARRKLTGNHPEISMHYLEQLWSWAIRTELKIDTFKDYSVVLVIPDALRKSNISCYMQLLLLHMRFQAVLFVQESVASVFGAGLSTALVLDIGAQTTSISCVEDGFCIPNSRRSLNFGGEDITRLFYRLLKEAIFPYKECNLLKRYLDFELLNDMKERFCTLNENDLTINMCDFYVREPGKPTKMFQIKVFSEVYLAPLAIIFPSIFTPSLIDRLPLLGHGTYIDYDPEDYVLEEDKEVSKPVTVKKPTKSNDPDSEKNEPMSENAIKEDEPSEGNAKSTERTPEPSLMEIDDENDVLQDEEAADEFSLVGIDFAILASIEKGILSVGTNTEKGVFTERAKKLLQSILVVGGSTKFPGLPQVLQDQLMYTIASAGYEEATNVEFLMNPRDLDSIILGWKGASVLSNIDGVSELFLTAEDWLNLGTKSLQAKGIIQIL